MILNDLITKHVRLFSDKPFVLVELPAHASERKYVRVIFEDGTSILATQASSRNEYSSYLYLAELMQEQNIPHPRIIKYYTPELLYFQDYVEGGDLYSKLLESNYSEKQGYLYAAIDVLIAFQGLKCVKYALAYPSSLLEPSGRFGYGLDLLDEYDPEFRRSLGWSNVEMLLRGKLLPYLTSCHFDDIGIVHRDFNPRNLLYDSCCGLQIIDFQGFRRGPQAYDLASLLQDSHLISDELRESTVVYYMLKKGINGSHRIKFIRHFNAMMLIRDIEACGIISMLVAKNAHPYFAGVYELYKTKAKFAMRILDSYK